MPPRLALALALLAAAPAVGGGAAAASPAAPPAPLALLAPPAAALPVATADYERLLGWRYGAPRPVPASGLEVARDALAIHLEQGTVAFQEPTAAGAVTGLVFEGAGRLRLAVPDPVERAQLRRYAGVEVPAEPAAAVLELAFARMVLRAPGLAAPGPGAAAPPGPFERSPLAAARHDLWLEQRFHDADARVVAALATPDDDYLLADLETVEHGWLTVEFEPARREELQLQRRRRGLTEIWVSLDRAEDREANGAPSTRRRDRLRLDHVDVAADLTEPARRGRRGAARIQPRRGKFSVVLSLTPRTGGARALQLVLTPIAEVAAVRLVGPGGGEELPFLRHAIGERSSRILSYLEDDSLVVLLPAPLEAGRPFAVAVDYEMDLLNYVSGRTWYPDEAESYFEDHHTGRLELVVPERIEVRAMGRRTAADAPEPGVRRELWEVIEPTFMLTFAFAERPLEEILELERAPRVVVFGPDPGVVGRARLGSVGADVARSAAFFGELLDAPLDAREMTVTSIVGHHGQAFDGFLQMGEWTFEIGRRGASELFRAHETAHQWWGHLVGWTTYRDQWLAESLAEYSAMMYLESEVPGGREHFDEILEVYAEALFGSMRGSMSRFARPSVVPLNPRHRAAVGPIAVGMRAATAEAPGGYLAQLYMKGPLVLHMLRRLLHDATGDDRAFVATLRDFVARHRGSTATTADFVAAAERHAPEPLGWFFDQWLYGTELPTYAWSHRVEPPAAPGGPHRLVLTVRQEGVGEGFRMPVPVRIDLGRGRSERRVVEVDEPEEVFVLELAAPPRRVELNPDRSVLARCVKGRPRG